MAVMFMFKLLLVVCFTLYTIDSGWIEMYGGKPQTPERNSITDDIVSPTGSTYQDTVSSLDTNERKQFEYCSNCTTHISKFSLQVIKYLVITVGVTTYTAELWMLYLRRRHCQKVHVGRVEKEFIRGARKKSNEVALQWKAYILGHIVIPPLMITVVVLLPLSTDRESHLTTFIDLMRVGSLLDVMLYLLFFLQLSPFFGPFIIIMMRLMTELLRFAVVLVICIHLFSLFFVVFVNTKSAQGCIPEYEDVPMAMYTVFTMSLNLVSFTQYDLVTPGVVYTLHVMCALCVGVLLFNFLIGVLSNSVAEMSANMDVICSLQHLMVVTTIEVCMWPFLRYYYRWIQSRYFTCRNGRVYIVRRLHPDEARKVVR